MIGTGDSWSFNYNLNYVDTSGTGMAVTIPVSGSYQDEGMKTISVGGDSYEAWHISSDYRMDLLSTGFFTRDYPAVANYYWVEGLGLVLEEHVDTETGSIILAKELTSSSGL